jgi:hypothetical protein
LGATGATGIYKHFAQAGFTALMRNCRV